MSRLFIAKIAIEGRRFSFIVARRLGKRYDRTDRTHTGVSSKSRSGRASPRRRVRWSLTPSIVTRYVGELEAELGVQLLVRTTRRVSLTVAGRLYVERIRPVVEEIDRTNEFVRQQQDAVKGAASRQRAFVARASVSAGRHRAVSQPLSERRTQTEPHGSLRRHARRRIRHGAAGSPGRRPTSRRSGARSASFPGCWSPRPPICCGPASRKRRGT